MNALADPRTFGFNYAGWGADPKPPVYHTAMKIARLLGTQAAEMHDKAWALEMAVRRVRLATHAVEKVRAVSLLEIELAKSLPVALPNH